MKRLSLLALLLVVVVLPTLNTGCTNLDEELFSEVTADNFFQSDEEFISALGAAYTSLYGYMGDYYGMQSVSSDEVVVPTRGNDWDDGGHWRRLHQHLYTPDDPLIGGSWSFCYSGIATCNRLIFQFNQLEVEGSEVFTAELEVLRALFYYWLLDTYGNVPIVDQFDVPDDFAPSNASRSEVYTFVEEEITRNLGNLSKSVDGSTYARINYYVAQAILAKLYLNAEVYTGTAQWSKAGDAADEIINSGAYSLAGSYFENFVEDNAGSPENIFMIPYDQVFAQGNNLVMRTLHYGSQATYNLTAQPWNGYSSVQEFYDSFDDDDLRKNMFIVGPQFASDGSRLEDSGAEDNDPDGPPLTFMPEINELGPNALRQAGARIGKWEFANGATEHLSNDMAIFRYADILLVKAEVMMRSGDEAGALAIVNQFRERAGIEGYTTLDEESFLAERSREMAFETHRRQDLIRFGKYGDAWWEKTASEECKELFPIPRGQLDANKNLSQNDCY